MFRLLMLLIVVCAGAYFTNPSAAQYEAKSKAVIEGRVRGESKAGDLGQEVVGWVRGMLAGEGKYENFYLMSRYTVDLPGADYVECLGGFTLISCKIVEPGAK